MAYFVLEHQPRSCAELPPNNNVTWTDVSVSVNGHAVASPEWVAKEEEPKCGSKAVITDPRTISITWEA